MGPTQLLTRSVRTGCGAHPASYSERPYRLWGPPSFLNKIRATLSPRGKTAGREAHHWRPSTAGVEVYIHFLLCLNGVQRVSSSLLTQTPQELRDNTTCLVLSFSHSWQSYFFILHWVISAVQYVHFVLSLSMQLWRQVYRIGVLLPPGIRSCCFGLEFSLTCFIEEFRSALNVWRMQASYPVTLPVLRGTTKWTFFITELSSRLTFFFFWDRRTSILLHGFAPLTL
jgi:hypothetical protein